MKEYAFGPNYQIILPGNLNHSLIKASELWVMAAQEACNDHGFFAVALSGGSTPLQIYKLLTSSYRRDIPWDKILLFWGDERSVPPEHKDSNYRMAIEEGGFGSMPIKKEHIFRMVAEKDIETNALVYEQTIKTTLKDRPFDLIMLGMGDDGHTASLFPHTKALHANNRLIIENFVPRLNTWRMTMTFDCLNQARHLNVYIFGESKASTVEKVFTSHYQPEEYPIQRLGTAQNRAKFILDDLASFPLLSKKGGQA